MAVPGHYSGRVVVTTGSAAKPGSAAKAQLRRRLLESRAGRSTSGRVEAATALAERALALPEIDSAPVVACYLSKPEEPGTRPLIEALTTRSCTVLLPVLHGDWTLDWAAYQPGAVREARFGIKEPTGRSLGVDAVAHAAVVFCPSLAVDETGRRLGRGGGSYDRMLARLPFSVLRVALLYDDEVLPAVPIDDHDQPVHVLVTPLRTIRVATP